MQSRNTAQRFRASRGFRDIDRRWQATGATWRGGEMGMEPSLDARVCQSSCCRRTDVRCAAHAGERSFCGPRRPLSRTHISTRRFPFCTRGARADVPRSWSYCGRRGPFCDRVVCRRRSEQPRPESSCGALVRVQAAGRCGASISGLSDLFDYHGQSWEEIGQVCQGPRKAGRGDMGQFG